MTGQRVGFRAKDSGTQIVCFGAPRGSGGTTRLHTYRLRRRGHLPGVEVGHARRQLPHKPHALWFLHRRSPRLESVEIVTQRAVLGVLQQGGVVNPKP